MLSAEAKLRESTAEDDIRIAFATSERRPPRTGIFVHFDLTPNRYPELIEMFKEKT